MNKLRSAAQVATLALIVTALAGKCDEGVSGSRDDSSPVISTATPSASLPPASSTVPTTQPPTLVRDCTVVRTVDGDTLHAECKVLGAVTIRVIGIDTPETKDPRKPVQCFGQQASTEAQRQLPAGQKIRIHTDPSQDERDRYGRLLAYVSNHGADYGYHMIVAGFAREYTYRDAYSKRSQYRRAETRAKAANRGLWGACPR